MATVVTNGVRNSVRRANLSEVIVEEVEHPEYEKLRHEVEATEADIDAALFGSHPRLFCEIAEWDGEPVGFAVWFNNFSTFSGRSGIYLEDLFVKAEWRGHGVGKRLLIHLARLAVERNCGRFEWAVLDWNEPAIEFYRRLGAQPLHEWTVFRVTGDELHELAGV